MSRKSQKKMAESGKKRASRVAIVADVVQNSYQLIPERMERPFLYQEEGEPKGLSMAIRKGDDAYIVFIPVQKHPASP